MGPQTLCFLHKSSSIRTAGYMKRVVAWYHCCGSNKVHVGSCLWQLLCTALLKLGGTPRQNPPAPPVIEVLSLQSRSKTHQIRCCVPWQLSDFMWKGWAEHEIRRTTITAVLGRGNLYQRQCQVSRIDCFPTLARHIRVPRCSPWNR